MHELYKYKNIHTTFNLNHVSFMLANGEMHINVFSNKKNAKQSECDKTSVDGIVVLTRKEPSHLHQGADIHG